jgi:hypothetical protein
MADSFSPAGGEAFVPDPTCYHKMQKGGNFNQKASPLREKLSKPRLFGTEVLTDVGVPAPLGRDSDAAGIGGRSRIAPTDAENPRTFVRGFMLS